MSQHHSSLVVSPFLTNPLYPLSSVDTFSNFSPLYQSYVFSYSLETEPTTSKQAMLSLQFRKATNDELNATEDDRIWTVVSLPPGKNVIGCKWVFMIKYRADGTVERYKSRLVIKFLLNKRVLTSQIYFSLLQSLPV